MCSTKKQADNWTLEDIILAGNFENSSKYNTEVKRMEKMLKDQTFFKTLQFIVYSIFRLYITISLQLSYK